MADDEPLLLYRSFRPFRGDGSVVKTAQVFSGTPDYEWLDAERARLEPRPTEATRLSPDHAASSAGSTRMRASSVPSCVMVAPPIATTLAPATMSVSSGKRQLYMCRPAE